MLAKLKRGVNNGLYVNMVQSRTRQQLLVKRLTKMSICTYSYEDEVCVHKISCLICCNHLRTFHLNTSPNEVCSQVSKN